MRFRTKLFIIWATTVLVPVGGVVWPLQRMLRTSFDRVANAGFAGTGQSLASIQNERLSRMRQAGALVMSIPELRALIAEQNYEIAPENLASLQERLDSLRKLVDVSFICVIDGHGTLIAQNNGSPWSSLPDLREYIVGSTQAQAMVKRLFKANPAAVQKGENGLWVYQGRIYQVVGLPLVFDSADDDQASQIDGALIMAVPMSDAIASTLGRSHDCDITFLAEGKALASSLPPAQRAELTAVFDKSNWPYVTPFNLRLRDKTYRSSLEPLSDACSGVRVGAMLVQSNTAPANDVQQTVWESLTVIMFGGLLVALVISFVLSGAVTRPVRDIVRGARSVAAGDLGIALPVKRHDELGELAIAFNDMVAGLRRQRELTALVEESQAANRAKGQFLANMSHEIRTPLHGVIGMSELLLRTGLNERQRRYVGLVKSSAEVLTTLINDILDFSKIESGKLELEVIDFDLSALVEDVVELMAEKAFAKGLEIASLIHPDVPAMVRGDATRVRQILLNLISNAVKFTQTGSVFVEVETVNQPGLSSVRFSVRDTGLGIPADRLDRLFKSFSQVDASTTRRFGGTGLGLAICKQLVELMGGAINVESSPGNGSTFSFAIAFAAAQANSSTATVRPILSGKAVLIVDDSLCIQLVIQQYLGAAGMHVQIASSGGAALATLRAAHASAGRTVILISDRLSGMSVTQFRAGLESGGLVDGVVLLPMSRSQNEDSNGTLHRPIRRQELLDAIASALDPAVAPISVAQDEPAAPALTRKPFRLLLAEDQEVNQIVASELLSDAGYAFDVVTDGLSAVSAIQKCKYDLILMDCQMPGMDGLEATHEIRRIEQERAEQSGEALKSIPIIALTANASESDRQHCLRAGMTGHCGKPFNARQLLETIAAHLPTHVDIVPPQTEAVDQSITLAGAEVVPFQASAVMERCTGKAALAAIVLEKFEKQAHEVIKQLDSCLLSNDLAGLARVSHSIKGTAGLFAADGLRSAAARLEEIGRNSEISLAAECVGQLRLEVDRCAAHAALIRQQMTSGSKAVLNSGD